MRRKLDAWGEDYEVLSWGEDDDSPLEPVHDVEDASRFLDSCRGDYYNMQALRSLYYDDQPASRPLDDDELLREMGRRLAHGELRIVHRPWAAPSLPVTSEAVEAPRLPARETTTWIEVVLVDEDGKPCPGVTYQVTGQGGGVVANGTLDEVGQARVKTLKPDGRYEVRFPELDGRVWQKRG